jgi:hypothetical protein
MIRFYASILTSAPILILFLSNGPISVTAWVQSSRSTSIISRTSSISNTCSTSAFYSAYYQQQRKHQQRIGGRLYASVTSNNGGEVTGKVKEVLKKMRGISVSVGYNASTATSTSTSSSSSTSSTGMEMEILSQELRKAKVASIFTSDLNAMEEFCKEQQMAKGNFPGPCPIIYDCRASVDSDFKNNVKMAIEKGASAIVLDMSDMSNVDAMMNDMNNMNDIINGVDVICRVENIHHVKQALDSGYEYAFLISGNAVCDTSSDSDDNNSDDSNSEDIQLLKILSAIPQGAVILASLDAMQKNSLEITRGKEVIGVVASTSTSTSNNKIHGLIIENACVGDNEDLKYTNFVVGGLTKKASSTFEMTGLTGSTNGHFGTMSDNASIENAKWRRHG